MRGIFRCLALGFGLLGTGWAAAQPTAGFPSEPSAPPPAPPPAVPPAPPPVPVPPPPAAPLAVEPHPASSPDPLALPQNSNAAGDYGSGLPEGPVFATMPPGFPAVLPYRPGYPIPTGYHAESRPATGLVVTGGLAFGLSYVTAVGIAFAQNFENGNGWLVVPLVGPWGAIGERSYKCEATGMDVAGARRCLNDAYDEATAIAILAGDGLIQAFGLALFIAGLANPTHELVRNDAKPVRVSAAPRPGGGVDLAVRGQF